VAWSSKHGLWHNVGGIGQSGSGDVHHDCSSSGHGCDHGDLPGGQQPRIEHGYVERRPGGESGNREHDDDGGFEPESFDVWPGGEFHGQRGVGSGDSDGDGAVLDRWQRVRFAGDAGIGSATSGSTSTLAEGTHTVTAVYAGVVGFGTSTGTLSGGQVVKSGQRYDDGWFQRESVGVCAVGDVDGDDWRRVRIGEVERQETARRKRDGDVEHEYGVWHDGGHVGQSGSGDVHDLQFRGWDLRDHGNVFG